MVAFDSWDIEQYVYSNSLLTRLWRHKFWNYPYLSNQAVFFLYAQKVKTNLKGSDVFRSIFGYIDTYTTSDPGVSVIHKDLKKMLMVIYWLKSLEPSGFSCFEIVYNGQNTSFLKMNLILKGGNIENISVKKGRCCLFATIIWDPNLAYRSGVCSSTNWPPFTRCQNSILNWVLKLNPLNQKIKK